MKPSAEYVQTERELRDTLRAEIKASEPAMQELARSLQAFAQDLEEEHREPRD